VDVYVYENDKLPLIWVIVENIGYQGLLGQTVISKNAHMNSSSVDAIAQYAATMHANLNVERFPHRIASHCRHVAE
jgi:hypothetical protein